MHQPKVSFELKIKISGEAGDGILTTGDVLMHAAAHLGYHSSVFKSFPPNIRGGYTQTMVTISDKQIISPVSQFDILFMTSEISLDLDLNSLPPGISIFLESALLKDGRLDSEFERWKKSGLDVQITNISKAARSVSRNFSIRSAVTLGYISSLLGVPVELMEKLICERFQKKSQDIVELNLSALKEGFLQAQTDIKPYHLSLTKIQSNEKDRIIVDGNHAISLGALISGAKFFASYPITPATSIGDTLAHYLIQNNGFAYQAEDEIAAIGAAIGASFSGTKSLTATSGPGLSLIQEFIGYASIIELPVVIVDVQRVGPSTGMPTKHSQDDLLAAAFGGHGEGQRIVIAPTGIQDCLYTTVEAFNLSEHYQCPVILLSDASMAMIKQTISYPNPESIIKIERSRLLEWNKNEPFLRYDSKTETINPIPIPGISPVSYRVTGIEHDEASTPTVNPFVRGSQMKRRADKLLNIEQEYPHLVEWDLESQDIYEADFSLIAWGLTASVARKAVDSMRQDGFRIAALYPKLLFPVLTKSIHILLKFSPKLFVPEANFSGQYSHIIRMYTDAKPHPLTISGDNPFTPEQIVTHISKRLEIEFPVLPS